MFEPDENGVYATLQASPLRRVFACAVLYFLGALIIYAPLAQPPAAFWLVFMIGFGALVLWFAEKLRRATAMSIELTENGLRDSSGRILATFEEIEKVERGSFAFKPSHGFTLVLHKKKPRAWAPGLWWRFGRRVGIGGTTPAGPAKFMAEQIAFKV